MDELHLDSPAQQIILMKGVQLGFTEGILMNGIGWVIAESPGSTMLVSDTDKSVKKINNQRLELMIRDSHDVGSKISKFSRATERNTAIHKDFEGGFLTLAGARTPSDLSSTSVRYLFMDEVDRYLDNTGGEGSPVELAIGRTVTYSRKKIVMGSTPVDEYTSIIFKYFKQGDQRKFYMPCPHCKALVWFDFNLFEWSDDLSEIYMKCPHCHEKIREKHKTEMMESGVWKPTEPDNINPLIKSYQISSLYSPVGFFSWKQFVQEKLKCVENPYYKKTFYNLYLGEPSTLSMEEYPIPEVLYRITRTYSRSSKPESLSGPPLIVCGVDIQDTRIEALVVIFYKRRAWIYDHYVFQGNTKNSILEPPWYDLKELFYSEILGKRIHLMNIDCGYLTYQTQAFLREIKNYSRLKLIKGTFSDEDWKMSIEKTPQNRDRGMARRTNRFHWINTHTLKREIYQRLLLLDPENDGYIDFPMKLEREFYEQLCAERMELASPDKILDRTRPHRFKWVASNHTRNEILDMLVYALGGWYHLGSESYLHSDLSWEKWIKTKDRQANF